MRDNPYSKKPKEDNDGGGFKASCGQQRLKHERRRNRRSRGAPSGVRHSREAAKINEQSREQQQPQAVAGAGSEGSHAGRQQKLVDLRRLRAVCKTCGAGDAHIHDVDTEIEV